MGTKTKVCTKCGKRKPLSAFAKDCTKKDGLKSQCKECMNATARASRALLKENQIKKQRLKKSEKSFKKALNEAVANRKASDAKPAKGKTFQPKQEEIEAVVWVGKMIKNVVKTIAEHFGLEVSATIILKPKE